MGVMDEIKGYLEEGRAAPEVIGMGYAPSTVFRVQRQSRRNGHAANSLSFAGSAQQPEMKKGANAEPQFEAENIELHRQVEDLIRQLANSDDLNTQFIEEEAELEAEVKTLRERVKALETASAAADQLRQRVQELEGQLGYAAHTQATMRQETLKLQGSVHAEHASHQITKAQANSVRQESQSLRSKLEEWRQWGANAQALIQSLTAEVEQLQPLKVWAGHPCKVCKRPIAGIVSREDAAKAMKDFGHTDCLKKDSGSGVGWVIGGTAALAALSALSQMRKGS